MPTLPRARAPRRSCPRRALGVAFVCAALAACERPVEPLHLDVSTCSPRTAFTGTCFGEAVLTYSDASSERVAAEWATSASSIVAVTPGSSPREVWLFAAGSGTATVTATYQGLSASATFTVP